jgi:hypothetical protein
MARSLKTRVLRDLSVVLIFLLVFILKYPWEFNTEYFTGERASCRFVMASDAHALQPLGPQKGRPRPRGPKTVGKVLSGKSL